VRQVAIGGSGERLWIGLVEQGRLVEWRNPGEHAQAAAGEIYLGRVTDVLPGMQSAFVEIGQGKKAYLYVDDAPMPKQAKQGTANIRECVREGEMLLVQVIKEAMGNKAPRITTRINLKGKCLVYLPAEEGVSISRKIGDKAVRKRLLEQLEGMLEAGEGVIVRTEAAEAEESTILEELARLRQVWQKLRQQASERGKPGRVSGDGEWLEQALRDLLAQDPDELLVEEAAVYQQVKGILALFSPEKQALLRRYQGKQTLADHLGVDVQLQQALRREVPLPGGGYLVLDRTEAMTVIDVNTGAFTGKGGQQREQAVTATNLEAASVIAAQLRLRDIGGIILIDFIDMKEAANKERVLAKLKEELSRDPVPSAVFGMTALGLVEMTRKRVRPSLAERISRPCAVCRGSGRVRSPEQLVRMLWDELEGLARSQEAEAAVVEMPTPLYEPLFGRGAEAESIAASFRARCPVQLHALHNPLMPPDEYRILYAGSPGEAAGLFASRKRQMP